MPAGLTTVLATVAIRGAILTLVTPDCQKLKPDGDGSQDDRLSRPDSLTTETLAVLASRRTSWRFNASSRRFLTEVGHVCVTVRVADDPLALKGRA